MTWISGGGLWVGGQVVAPKSEKNLSGKRVGKPLDGRFRVWHLER